MKNLNKIDTQTIVKKLIPLNPEKIILFGSYAKGNPKPESDIDLLIIKITNQKPGKRIEQVLKLTWGNIPHIEPQVLTPEEFKQAIEENRFFITEEVLKYGKILYEKQ